MTALYLPYKYQSYFWQVALQHCPLPLQIDALNFQN